jgi:hypothetical protein
MMATQEIIHDGQLRAATVDRTRSELPTQAPATKVIPKQIDTVRNSLVGGSLAVTRIGNLEARAGMLVIRGAQGFCGW